jgi:hypothetical protein
MFSYAALSTGISAASVTTCVERIRLALRRMLADILCLCCASYQRCGFRMDHIRHDYFRYYREPVFEHGIQVRDMLVFSYDLRAQSQEHRSS